MDFNTVPTENDGNITENLEFDWDIAATGHVTNPSDVILSNLLDKVPTKVDEYDISSFIVSKLGHFSNDELKSISVALASLANTGIPKHFSFIKPIDRTKVVTSIKTMPNAADLKTCLNALVIMEAVKVNDRKIETRDGPLLMLGCVVHKGLDPRSGAFPVLTDEIEKKMLVDYYEDRNTKHAYSGTIVSMTNPLSNMEFDAIRTQLKGVNTFSLEKLRKLGDTAGNAKFAVIIAKSIQGLVDKVGGSIPWANIATQLNVSIAASKTTLDSCRKIRSVDNHEAETNCYYYVSGATRNTNLLVWIRNYIRMNNYTLGSNLGNQRWSEALIMAGNKKLNIALEVPSPKGDNVKELDTLVASGHLKYSATTKIYDLSDTADDLLVMVALDDKPAFTNALTNTLLKSKYARILPSPTPHNTHTFISFFQREKRVHNRSWDGHLLLQVDFNNEHY